VIYSLKLKTSWGEAMANVNVLRRFETKLRLAKDSEVFRYFNLSFDIDKAERLTKGHRAKKEMPERGWMLPMVNVDDEHAMKTDLSRPVIFATVVSGGKESMMLIDGYHRIHKALKEHEQVFYVVLTLDETKQIVSGPTKALQAFGLTKGRKRSANEDVLPDTIKRALQKGRVQDRNVVSQFQGDSGWVVFTNRSAVAGMSELVQAGLDSVSHTKDGIVLSFK